MSERMNTMSVAQYAKARGIDEAAIRQQIVKGVVKLYDGLVNVDQADGSWGRIRRARMGSQDDDDGRRSAQAKIMGAAANLRLAKDRLEAARERYHDRADAVALAGNDMILLLSLLRAVPQQQTPGLAAALGISRRAARRILTRFMALALSELGDLEAEAVRLAEAA